MTYEEVVQCVRAAYENADAREIYEHIAIQVNITGEGEGAFYIEVAGRAVCVEPYDYYDRDGLMTISSDTIVEIAKGNLTFEQAYEKGLLKLEGNMDKFRKVAKIKPEVPHKKRTPKTEVKTEKDEKKTEVKVAPKKAAPKKEAKAEAKPAETKAEAKAEAKPAEPKAEAKAEEKPAEAKAEAKPAESKAEAAVEPKAEAKPKVRVKPKATL